MSVVATGFSQPPCACVCRTIFLVPRASGDSGHAIRGVRGTWHCGDWVATGRSSPETFILYVLILIKRVALCCLFDFEAVSGVLVLSLVFSGVPYKNR